MQRVIVFTLGVLALASPVAAQAVASGRVTRGSLAFDAHATMGDFTATTTAITGQVVGAAGLADVSGWVETAATSLTSHNDHRDRDMQHSLESGKYPLIRFELRSVSRDGPASGDSSAVTLHGRFTIHGQTLAADVPGWVWLDSDSVRFRGAVPLDCKDYGIGGLTKFLGVLKMDQHITVRVDVVFAT